MKYKLIIFDLDGTVLDTLEDLADAVNYSLKKNNLPERTINEIRSFVGNGIRLLVERSVPAETEGSVTDAVFDDFKAFYKIHSCDKTKPYSGINELLSELRKNNIRTAVVSNKADFAVQDLVNKYFDGLFDFAVGERDGIQRKPSPDSVFEAIRYFDNDASKTLYIGDSEVDIETAKNAMIDCVCVSWGFRDNDVLLSNGADVIVNSVNDLKKYIVSCN